MIRPWRITEMRSETASTSRSLWVMKMMERPLRGKRAHGGEELARLLRRQHGGRLVEDQDLGVAIERLQDLHALAQADRKRADHGARIEVEPELVG